MDCWKVNRHLRFLFHLFPCRPPLPPAWVNFSGPVNRHTLTSSAPKVSLNYIPVLSYMRKMFKWFFCRLFTCYSIWIGHRTEVIKKKGPDKGEKSVSVCELQNNFILKLDSQMWPSVGCYPIEVGISRVDLYFALFFTASGWLPARSLTSLSATAQSAFYHLPSDTFSSVPLLELTRTEFCAVRLLFPDSGKTGDLMKVLFFFSFYFVGTNKYNLCQGCLRGSM